MSQFDNLPKSTHDFTGKKIQSVKKVGSSTGYDGHSLRAFAYFGEQMPDIVDTVESINSIQVKYKHLRSDSQAQTFLLTYGGTYMGLMKNSGFREWKRKTRKKRYHELYVVADAWVQARLDEAGKTGYGTAEFGYRVCTRLL